MANHSCYPPSPTFGLDAECVKEFHTKGYFYFLLPMSIISTSWDFSFMVVNTFEFGVIYIHHKSPIDVHRVDFVQLIFRSCLHHIAKV